MNLGQCESRSMVTPSNYVEKSGEHTWACIEVDDFFNQNVRKRMLTFSNIER